MHTEPRPIDVDGGHGGDRRRTGRACVSNRPVLFGPLTRYYSRPEALQGLPCVRAASSTLIMVVQILVSRGVLVGAEGVEVETERARSMAANSARETNLRRQRSGPIRSNRCPSRVTVKVCPFWAVSWVNPLGCVISLLGRKRIVTSGA